MAKDPSRLAVACSVKNHHHIWPSGKPLTSIYRSATHFRQRAWLCTLCAAIPKALTSNSQALCEYRSKHVYSIVKKAITSIQEIKKQFPNNLPLHIRNTHVYTYIHYYTFTHPPINIYAYISHIHTNIYTLVLTYEYIPTYITYLPT
jgi:hypothetical protein